MLTELRVRDLGVLEDVTITFGEGMTSLTGETGAGKTLLVEALQLVLGARGSAGLVRAGSEEALVEARFEVLGSDGESIEITLARSVAAAGRSRAWVDGRMVPVSALSEIGADLVDIHGQHDHQSLLSAHAQRQALDTFADIDTAALDEAKRGLRELEGRLDALGGNEQQRAREIDMLSHQVREIDEAHLEEVDEEATLLAEVERLADLGAHREAAAAALEQLDGAELNGNEGALQLLGLAAAALMHRSPFAEAERRLRALATEAEDVASDLRHAVEIWLDDPVRLEELQLRQRKLTDLRHKYGATLVEVITFAAEAKKRLAELEDAAGAAEVLMVERIALLAEISAMETAIRLRRLTASPLLSEAVEARLADLAMAGSRLEVSVSDLGAGEPIGFLLSANLGEPVQPLAKVASGGELARAMLALRLAAMGGPPTMIFDEVDAGVGGATALALAASLHEVSRDHQVIVVTHLAQVGAYADQQIAVRKRTADARTVTEAETLTREGRVTEISRMLSGHPDSSAARAHAEELLALMRD